MSLRQQLHAELDAVNEVASIHSDGAWWGMLEATVANFAAQRKLTWMNPNEEVHKWLRLKENGNRPNDHRNTLVKHG